MYMLYGIGGEHSLAKEHICSPTKFHVPCLYLHVRWKMVYDSILLYPTQCAVEIFVPKTLNPESKYLTAR
jgi:hypothetical protein